MPRDDVPTFRIDNATLIFKNFQGKEGQFNRKGDRNFNVILDEEFAQKLYRDGWNVKWMDPREEGEPSIPTINIAVNFQNKPPRITMITSGGRTHLNDDTVEILDWADIAVVDLIARAYDWEVSGNRGRKAYLQTMFVTIEEDELERKYAQKPKEHHE